jgi:hypothetical protein
LLHIRDEIEGVAMIVGGLSFVQYQGSYLHRRAVERAVQIVSEAAKALPPDSSPNTQTRRGVLLSGSVISCAANTSTSMIINFGKSRRFTCPDCNQSSCKC